MRKTIEYLVEWEVKNTFTKAGTWNTVYPPFIRELYANTAAKKWAKEGNNARVVKRVTSSEVVSEYTAKK